MIRLTASFELFTIYNTANTKIDCSTSIKQSKVHKEVTFNFYQICQEYMVVF